MRKRKTLTAIKAGAIITDAELNAFAAEVFSMFEDVGGLVQTADTGQIAEPPALVVPTGATNVYEAGYRIYRFNDPLQEQCPIFVRINVCVIVNSTTNKAPCIEVQVGQGSNGAGVITGATGVFRAFDRSSGNGGFAASMAAAPKPTFACAGDGFFWFSLKVGAIPCGESGSPGVRHPASASLPLLTIGIFRSVDDAGEPTAQAFDVLCSPLYGNYSAGIAYAPSLHYLYLFETGRPMLADYGFASTTGFRQGVRTVEGKPIVHRAYMADATGVRPIPYMGVVYPTALAELDEFDAVLAGTEPRHYIFPSIVVSPVVYQPTSEVQISAPVFLWEGDDV